MKKINLFKKNKNGFIAEGFGSILLWILFFALMALGIYFILKRLTGTI